MPTPAYIKIVGQTQGNITAGAFTADSVGNVFQQGHEDQILVQEIKHEVTTPTDPQSGQPSGQRVHKPFIFTSSLNKATPLMYQALANGEMLPTSLFTAITETTLTRSLGSSLNCASCNTRSSSATSIT